MSPKKSEDNQRLHEELSQNIRLGLDKFVAREWVVNYNLQEQNSFCDSIGIDGISWFKFNKGCGGDLSFQIKTRQSDVNLHHKKHPGIPAVIVLRPGSSLREVEEEFIKFFWKWTAFNEGKRRIILRKYGKILNSK